MNYNNNAKGNQWNKPAGGNSNKTEVYKVNYEKLNDDNYVETAEEVLLSFKKEEENSKNNANNRKNNNFEIVTTTKLRNLLAMISDIYNDVVTPGSTEGNSDKLKADITKRINYLKVKVVYESGREESVKKLVDRANISRHLDDVIKSKSKTDFILFSRYMEALVAYRKFYFKGDK
ncbi:CRISPR type III-A/MTUBE-associated protein Csm2 [Peptostreptococcaceae bacterium AS15]|nr:CRISPR type III-A/MTUBE-associated protein Csm2 [Peptostreptococcaceae bacterium AS15]